MKKVLIVDDEAFIIKLLTRVLTNYVKDLALFTAEDGEEAVSILSNESIDLVITDLQMPVMDGFELIAYIMENFHSLPIIVLTNYSEEKLGKKPKQNAFLTFVQKHNLDFRAFSEQVTKSLTPATKGHIEGITLFSFLQLLSLDKKTCTLILKSSGQKGFLYFSEGQLISAVCEGIESIYSAYEILVWDDARIEINNVCRKKKNIVNTTLEEVLMEAFRIKDEANREKNILSTNTLDKKDLSLSEYSTSDEIAEEVQVSKSYSIQQAIAEIITLPGVISFAIVDGQEQRCLAYEQRTGNDNPLTFDLAIGAIFANLERKGQVESILITFLDTYYLFFPPINKEALVFYLVLDRVNVDLAQIRIKLNQVARNITLHKETTAN
ncbi:MAG: response regulator receiver [bacterium]|nr:MAG: response regulator receiver [bacterium]